MLPEIIPNWHPIFVHFTIALFSIATVLLVVSCFLDVPYKDKILTASYINLWLGCLITIITIAAGFYAYYTVSHDEPSHIAMTNHKNWAIPTTIFFWLLGLWSIKLFNKDDKTNKFFIVLMIITSLALAITGWKGGEVVYRYGIGVISLPNTDEHKHDKTEMDHSSQSSDEMIEHKIMTTSNY